MIKKRLVSLMADSKKYIAQNVLWQWLGLIMSIVTMTVTGWLLEAGFTGRLSAAGRDAADGDFAGIGRICLAAAVILGAVAVRAFCTRKASMASYLAGSDVKKELRKRLYEKLQSLGASYHEKVPTAEAVQVAVEGVEQLEIYFGKYLPQLFYSLLAPVTLFAVLSMISLRASLVLLICVPLIPATIMAVQKLAKRLLARYWGIYTELGDSFLENLQGLTTLKIYQADEMKAREMDAEAEHFRKITMKVLMMQLNSIIVMDVVAYGGAAAGIIVTLREYLAGNIGLAGALTIVLLSSEFFIPMRMLGSFFHIAMNGMAASDKLFAILDLDEGQKGEQVLPDGPLAAVFDHVEFAYEPDRPILKQVSLQVPEKGMVSLVGLSGCGKSTIAGLLTGRNRGYRGNIRFLSPQGTGQETGAVRGGMQEAGQETGAVWDGMQEAGQETGAVRADLDARGGLELSEIAEGSLMEHVALVSHNSYLFKGTVEENLRMAAPDASKEELLYVLNEVNLYEFLMAQGGLSMKLEERGANLSGGQCQRLALARALLRDTPVYIFDEAASNIDAESEEQIMKVVRRLALDHAVLFISHRLANVVESERIYVLKDGQVAEEGRHMDLMERDGIYAGLFRTQKALEQYGTGTDGETGGRKYA